MLDDLLGRIAKALGEAPFGSTCEADLQIAIEERLRLAGLGFEREAKLSSKDRLDFTVWDADEPQTLVGLEVKIQGSLTEVARQVHRYACLENLAAVVVVTTKAKHRGLPRVMNNKPIRVFWLPLLP